MIRKSLYEVMVERGPEHDCVSRTMLVLAEDKQDAERLVGGDCRVVAVRHNGAAARAVGPSRVIGWSRNGAGKIAPTPTDILDMPKLPAD